MKHPERLVIQDEIQHRLIAAVFSHEIASRLVFYGGTMLRVCGMSEFSKITKDCQNIWMCNAIPFPKF